MQHRKDIVLYAAWAVALLAAVGSLYFSNVMDFAPCVLCWYQRIFMYPLVFVIAVGIFLKDRRIYHYVLPLSVIGFAISIYHNLLYYKIIPERVAPCVTGVSCTTKFVEYFGFVTIPFLSMCAFLAIIVLMLVYRTLTFKENT